jgi:hypothetical protein
LLLSTRELARVGSFLVPEPDPRKSFFARSATVERASVFT